MCDRWKEKKKLKPEKMETNRKDRRMAAEEGKSKGK